MESEIIVSVKTWFKSQKQTQQETAAALGISRQYLGDMINNKGGSYFTNGKDFYIKKEFKATKTALQGRNRAA